MYIQKITFNLKNIKKNSYLTNLCFKKITSIDINKNIIFLVGENGIGKTTLMESLAYEFNLNKYGGSKNFIQNKEEKPQLFEYILITKNIKKPKDAFFFRSDSFFNLDLEIKKYNSPSEYYSGEKDFKEQSHGESFISFFKNRIGENGLYFFDEPETALSYENQLLFLFMLKEFEKKNNQIFIITHSPILLSYPNSEILALSSNEINKIRYEQTEQYKNYKNFLENYKRFQNEIEKN